MGRFIAFGSDFHGDYNQIDSLSSKLPYGTNIYYAGDMNGPKGKWFTEKIKHSLTGSHTDEEFFSSIINHSKQNTPEHKQFVAEANTHTKKSIEMMAKHSARTPIAAAMPGNNELYHGELWKSYSTPYQSAQMQFKNSFLPYEEMPVVHFYKNGQFVDGEDAKNVDTAVIVLPYQMTKKLNEDLLKARGEKPTGEDNRQNAINEITREGGIIDQVKAANPKFVYQIQHEEVDSNSLRHFFKNPVPTSNHLVYKSAINGINKFRETSKSRILDYQVMYGHIDRPKFRQKVSVDGKFVDTIHLNEANELLLIDTMTGKIYDSSETPKPESETPLQITEIGPSQILSSNNTSLEQRISDETASSESSESTSE